MKTVDNEEKALQIIRVLPEDVKHPRAELLLSQLIDRPTELRLRAVVQAERRLSEQRNRLQQHCDGLRQHLACVHRTQTAALRQVVQTVANSPHSAELAGDIGELLTLLHPAPELLTRWKARMQHLFSEAEPQLNQRNAKHYHERGASQLIVSELRIRRIFPTAYNALQTNSAVIDWLLGGETRPDLCHAVEAGLQAELMATPLEAGFQALLSAHLAAQVSFCLAHGLAASLLACPRALDEVCRLFLYTTRCAELVGAAHSPIYDECLEFFSMALPGLTSISAQPWDIDAAALRTACSSAPSTTTPMWTFWDTERPWRSQVSDPTPSVRSAWGLVKADRIATFQFRIWNYLGQRWLSESEFHSGSEASLLKALEELPGNATACAAFEPQRQFSRIVHLDEEWPEL
jgi:hypothetical protein